MKIRVLSELDETTKKKLLNFTDFTIYHLPEWHRVLMEAFGWNVKYIVGCIEDQIVFFLPYIKKYRFDLKQHNISLPLSHRIGIAFDPNYSAYYNEFINRCLATFKAIEVHDQLQGSDLQYSNQNYITSLDLSKFSSTEAIYKVLDYKSVKYEINKANKQGVEVTKILDKNSITYFYKLEVQTRRRQGAPVYPKNFFLAMLKNLPKEILRLYLAKHHDTTIAGSIFFSFNGKSIYAYSASENDNSYRKLGASELIMWSAIQDAFNEQIKVIDFGTTPVHLTSLKKFKEKWGGISTNFPYTVISKTTQHVAINRDGKMAKLVSFVLKSMPEPIFRQLGPLILKVAI